jgi:hypothetical protein
VGDLHGLCRRDLLTDFPFKDEAAFQIATAILLRKELAADVVWFHVPNGEKRDIATAKKLKEMGVRPGVADFMLFRRDLKLALELKTPKGVLSENQKGFRDAWTALGGAYEIARDLSEVRSILFRKHGLL